MTAQTSHHDQSDQTPMPHVPVLPAQVLQYLDPGAGESYLDLTAGYGGHARLILERTGTPKDTVLVDRDANAVRELQKVFRIDGPVSAGSAPDIRQTDFLSASRALLHEGRRFNMILADLGVSSPHLDQASRGFAIAADGPLDMRMDQSQPLTAAMIVNEYDVARLTDILKRYGEEPKAHAIARKIVDNRPFDTTTHLADVVARVWPGHSRVHPATRTFQALRIAVNDELQLVEHSLPLWFDLLAPGGRIAVISFHSLEDRLVKIAMQAAGGVRNDYDAKISVLTKRPVTADDTELVTNPRARSAKLRAAVKKL